MTDELELILEGKIGRLRGDALADRVGAILGALVALEFETCEQFHRRVGKVAIDVITAHRAFEYQD